MAAKGKITRIRVEDYATGTVYADGLEFNVPIPWDTMLNWYFYVSNIGDVAGTIILHLVQVSPWPGEWFKTNIPIEAGSQVSLATSFGFSPSGTTFTFRLTAERNSTVDDSYLLTADWTTRTLTSKREAVAIPAGTFQLVGPLAAGFFMVALSFFALRGS